MISTSGISVDEEREYEFVVPDLKIAVSESPELRKEIEKLRKKYAGLTFLFDQLLDEDVEDE